MTRPITPRWQSRRIGVNERAEPPGPDLKGPIFRVRSRAAAPAAPETGETEIYSQAYSAPESEQFTSGPYVPADSGPLRLRQLRPATERRTGDPPRWPWVVGVVAIVAAIALVVSVSVLVTRTDTSNLATPDDHDHHARRRCRTRSPRRPPPTAASATADERGAAATAAGDGDRHPGAAASAAAARRGAATTARRPRRRRPPPTRPRRGRGQVTYSVTGTKAPGDSISVTYIDASGRSARSRTSTSRGR